MGPLPSRFDRNFVWAYFPHTQVARKGWPKEMGLFVSVSELDEALRQSGYIAGPVTVTTVFLAGRLHRPVLLEGPAGSGKTQLAYAVAEAAHIRVERLQCYEGINEEKAIGRFDESLQRLFVQYQAQFQEIDWDELALVLQGRGSSALDLSYWLSNTKNFAYCSSTNSTG